MNLADHTGLGRHLDVRIPSNRLVVLGSAAAGVIAFTVTWLSASRIDLPLAAAVGLSVFLAWAIARELDPDHNVSATLALGLAAVGVLLGSPAPGAAGVTLLALRLMVGSVGGRLRPADLVVLVLVAAYAATRPEAWPAGVVLIAAVLVAGVPRVAGLVAAMVAAGLVAAVLGSTGPDPGWPSPTSLALVGITIIATIVSFRVGAVISPPDTGVGIIAADRVRAARVAAGLAVVAGSLLTADGAVVLVPVTAALLGVAATSLRIRPAGITTGASPATLNTAA